MTNGADGGTKWVITIVLPMDASKRMADTVLALVEGGVPAGTHISYTDGKGTQVDLMTLPETTLGKRIREVVAEVHHDDAKSEEGDD